MKILFFDGYCTLCNSLVDWGLAHDRTKQIKFASLQGETAKRLVADSGADLHSPDTVVYSREGQVYYRSDAILFFLKDLNGPFGFVSVLFIIPKVVRDFFYKIVARNRYRFFKKRETCRLPRPDESDRLLN